MSDAARFTATKTFRNLPTCHRAWRAASHCRFVHGYSRSYSFHFACSELSPEGFVVDFGGLKQLKEWLEYWFDHTVLVAADDPALHTFQQLHDAELIDMRVMDAPTMEGSARFVFEYADALVREQTGGRAWCVAVEARENDKNGAWYRAQS